MNELMNQQSVSRTAHPPSKRFMEGMEFFMLGNDCMKHNKETYTIQG